MSDFLVHLKPFKRIETTSGGEVSLLPEDIRVPNERATLVQGAMWTTIIAAILLTIVISFALRLPNPADIIVISLVVVWLIAPYAVIVARMFKERAFWARMLKESPRLSSPPTRLNPQTIVHEICQFLPGIKRPEVVLLSGKPALLTLDNQIIVTSELYDHTSDRDLLVLFIHELGHHFTGHYRLLPLARAVPVGEAENFLRMMLLPGLMAFNALVDWILWAEVTADRLVVIMKPDPDLAILGVMKQVVLMAPDSQSRNNLVHFLSAADSMIDRGEELLISNQISSLFMAHPEAETRINNLRIWYESDGYSYAAKRLREGLNTKRSA